MAIDEVYKINTLDKGETNTLKKALSYVHEQAVGTQYVSVAPTEVPVGKIVIFDDGVAHRLYVRTGTGNVGYVNLTMI